MTRPKVTRAGFLLLCLCGHMAFPLALARAFISIGRVLDCHARTGVQTPGEAQKSLLHFVRTLGPGLSLVGERDCLQ